jgi:hypothetical protein
MLATSSPTTTTISQHNIIQQQRQQQQQQQQQRYNSPTATRYHRFPFNQPLIISIKEWLLVTMKRMLNLKLSVLLMALLTVLLLLQSIHTRYYKTSADPELASSFWSSDVMDAIHYLNNIYESEEIIDPDEDETTTDTNGSDNSNNNNEEEYNGGVGDDEIGGLDQGGGNSLLLSEWENSPYNKKGKGVFFSNTSYDFRDCTSPEIHVQWPLEGIVHSKTSPTFTCGMKSSSKFSTFLKDKLWKDVIRPLTENQCADIVVFGVAFGGDFVKDLDAPHVRKLVNATDLIGKHNRCFFIFTLEEDIVQNKNNVNLKKVLPSYDDHNNNDDNGVVEPVMIGHNILIPIPREILPYRNPRRNVKLLKYMGQFMFRQAKTVIWQDAKFFRDDFVSKQPVDYELMVQKDACVSAVGLPVHKGTVGLENIREWIMYLGRYRPQYEHHCHAIIDALIDRPNVTDSARNLITQCDAYLQHVYLKEGNIEAMNQGLIDSAFIIWNQRTPKCREFNSALRCTIMDQIQCHSDRDQVSIPFALYTMGLSGVYSLHPGNPKQPVDRNWDPRIHDLDFVSKDDNHPTTPDTYGDVMVRVIRSSCHWYFSRLGDCRRTGLSEGKPSLAIMATGTAKRYMLTGFVDHVIEPLVNEQNTNVDYYLMLSVKQGLAYRTDEFYMRYQTYDKPFAAMAAVKEADTVTQYLFDKIRDTISHAGANIGGIHIQPSPMKLDPPTLRKKQIDAKRARPKEDSYYRFPMLDLRPEHKRRTAVSNRNIFKHYLGLQKLWEKHLITSEHYMGVSYDYVMILQEDTLWLEDFNLQKLIATNPTADAYVLSCDVREPPATPVQYNDHGIVIKREKAAVVGRYFKKLLTTNLNECHRSVQGIAPNNTGCDHEMLFYWILTENNITVQRVPQSLLPFERSMVLAYKHGKTETCIHRYCQSQEAPLKLPSNLKICRDMEVPADTK